jgi:hypothetical protein
LALETRVLQVLRQIKSQPRWVIPKQYYFDAAQYCPEDSNLRSVRQNDSHQAIGFLHQYRAELEIEGKMVVQNERLLQTECEKK